MFSRRSTLVFESILSETKRTGIRHSAQSKKNRVQVQLLENVQGYGYKGEIVTVKASVAIDILTPKNKAYFLLKGQTPRIPVVERVQRAAPIKVKKPTTTEYISFADAIKTAPESAVTSTDAEPKLMSLEDLLNVDTSNIESDNLKTIMDSFPRSYKLDRRSNDTAPLKLDRVLYLLIKQASKSLPGFLSCGQYLKTGIVPSLFNSEGKQVQTIKDAGEYEMRFVNSKGEIDFVCQITA